MMASFVIHQQGDLSEVLQSEAWKVLKLGYSNSGRRLYEELVKDIYSEDEDAVYSLALFVRKTGIAKSAIIRELDELANQGLVTVSDMDEYSVIDVDFPHIEKSIYKAFDTIELDKHVADANRTKRLLLVWQAQFEKYQGIAWHPWSGDKKIAMELCRIEPEDKRLEQLVKYYWLYLNDGENASFATFKREFDSIASRFQLELKEREAQRGR